MTKIECILRPSKVKEVKDALGSIGIKGMTVTEAVGCGLQKGHIDMEIEAWENDLSITLLPKTKLEMIITDDILNKVIDTIIKAARTGQVGDGKIFTYHVNDVIRIRTSETGEEALIGG